MDLRQLRYFTAIVEEGSFSRAAVRLGIAQPALSLHVRRMEEDLGIALLIRQASGVTPTEAGQLLVTRARAVLSDVQSLQDELRDVGGQPSGTVRIGLPGTISVILSVPLITRIRRDYPRIKIIVAEAMSGFVRDWLRDGRIDLAVLYGDPGEAALTTLTDAPLILPSESHELRRMVERHLRGSGGAVEPAIEMDSYPLHQATGRRRPRPVGVAYPRGRHRGGAGAAERAALCRAKAVAAGTSGLERGPSAGTGGGMCRGDAARGSGRDDWARRLGAAIGPAHGRWHRAGR